MNTPDRRVLASNMKRCVPFCVWAIHIFRQICFALKHLEEIFAVVRSDQRKEKGTVNDRIAGEDPEKTLGCVVEVFVVGSTVKLPRTEDGQKVRQSNAKEGVKVDELFVFFTDTKLLVEIVGVRCETCGKFGVRKAAGG